MSEKNIKEEIRLAAKELGIEQIGFCPHEGKSAVCCLFPYYHNDGKDANISMYARGVDYHVLAKEKLSTLLSPFTENFEIRVLKTFDNRIVKINLEIKEETEEEEE